MNDKTAVVTGGASGLGWSISQALAGAGYKTILIDKSEQGAERAAKLVDQGASAFAFQCDLSDPEATQAAAAQILEYHGRCDVLVNNAGIHFKTSDGHRFTFDNIQLREWNLSLALHMTAPMLLSQAFLPGMKKRGWGRIINIASRAGRTYLVNASAFYSASKAGLIGLTRSIAGEYAQYGITCNAIAPGRFKTPLTDQCADDIKQYLLSQLPVGREGNPSEVAAVVKFLSADDAGFITGIVLDINGGSFMGP